MFFLPSPALFIEAIMSESALSYANYIPLSTIKKTGSSLPAAHSVSVYRCSLPGLAGFADCRCAGPDPKKNAAGTKIAFRAWNGNRDEEIMGSGAQGWCSSTPVRHVDVPKDLFHPLGWNFPGNFFGKPQVTAVCKQKRALCLSGKAPVPHRRREGRYFMSITTRSTRRFLALPSLVLFVAMGRLKPYPTDESLVSGMLCETRKSRTFFALRVDRSLL